LEAARVEAVKLQKEREDKLKKQSQEAGIECEYISCETARSEFCKAFT
jgi:hypothetical protein